MLVALIIATVIAVIDGPQVAWERSLEDALAVAAPDGRPLLVAVNMDGESACERIVYENYKDVSLVEDTRRFTCLISSFFRHTPRDHDDRGRRIPCPRLGAVTCGEHIALESVCYDRFLGGDRIAPRHAVVVPGDPDFATPDRKLFDLRLLFDLSAMDRRLAEAAKDAPPPPEESTSSADAGARGAAARRRFEAAIEAAPAHRLTEVVGQIRRSGNEGSIEALRLLAARAPELGDVAPEFALSLADTAGSLGIGEAFRVALLELLNGDAATPRDPRLGARDVLLLPLARFGTDQPGTVTRLLAHVAFTVGDDDRAMPVRALRLALGERTAAAVLDELDALGGPLDLGRWTTEGTHSFAVADVPPLDPRTEEEALTDLDAAVAALTDGAADGSEDGDAADVQVRLGLASLRVAQLRLESGGDDIDLLLKDAEFALSNAAEAGATDPRVALGRARTAYSLSKHSEQERMALDALARLDATSDLTEDPLRLDALRWLGDAGARLISERSGGDPIAELRGMRRAVAAYAEVAGSAAGHATDRLSLVSLLGLLGRVRIQTALGLRAIDDFPEDVLLRNELNRNLWFLGRPDRVASLAAAAAMARPASGFAAWYEGYGHAFHAESLRRQHRPDDSSSAYQRAVLAYDRARTLAPDFEASCAFEIAKAMLGRGFADLLAQDQARAARCLVEAVAMHSGVVGLRDGLDREALDLLDGSLEWRFGRPSPVDALDLLAQLAEAAPDLEAYWARWVSDSELREALRADGRGDAELCDTYLVPAMHAGRRAVLADMEDPANRHALAQALTIQAELWLTRGRTEGVAALLTEAAPFQGIEPPSDDADQTALAATAAALRELLGEPRPQDRPGR